MIIVEPTVPKLIRPFDTMPWIDSVPPGDDSVIVPLRGSDLPHSRFIAGTRRHTLCRCGSVRDMVAARNPLPSPAKSVRAFCAPTTTLA